MKAGSYARGLPETEFLPYSPYAKTSPTATRHHRVADLPAALAPAPPTVPSIAPTLPGRYLPCCHKAPNSISAIQAAPRSRGTLGEERRRVETRRANFSPLRRHTSQIGPGHGLSRLGALRDIRRNDKGTTIPHPIFPNRRKRTLHRPSSPSQG
jgi:hypothetical protein